MFNQTDELAVNAVRILSIDMINKANSGHPGLPMGSAPMAYALWAEHMVQNPSDPHWTNRDRFVLSAGHGSALLYSLLHLSGYHVTMDDIKQFRQLNSKTPGHPEVHFTEGVEATTGPLGQGLANAVGMAMAEAHDAAIYNQGDYKIVDHYTYALCGDGDLMEGISHEAASLAGHLQLGKLIVFYDSNDISLDGPTDKAFTEDNKGRFEAYGWQHILVEDGRDLDALSKAVEEAKAESNKPTLIQVKTVIGYGSENEGTSATHGNPIGEEDRAHAAKIYGWEHEAFDIPKEVYNRFKERVADRGAKAQAEWQEQFKAYEADYAELAAQYKRAYAGELPVDWADCLPSYDVNDEAMASRKTSQKAIQAIAQTLPEFWGGSADLKSSNNTYIDSDSDFEAGNYAGRNIWYGVREFAMGAAMNGIRLHGGSIPYAGTFFVFSDYLRAAMRVAALSNLPSTFVFTHDSIAVGEDGPTHEPIEQLAAFRAMPNINTIRPADGNEVSAAWKVAIEAKDTPTVLALSRQNLPVLKGTADKAMEGVARGAYVLSDAKGETPDGILIATGSEVNLALQAQEELAKDGIDVRVVSMPCQELFDQEDQAYKDSVLPSEVKNRMAIEMAATFGWERYVGDQGVVLGLDRFGQSGKGGEVMEALGFSLDNVVKTYKNAF
ncbi:transketolase [Aerococcus urinae]|uniref:transketolase n=1 Tax=Aerococcus urinae TaxID=1376 RepID=UPI00254D1D12|nr:transketolase [Aerococcus urinae]MDK6372396.1 transketolase [Aerococcus urinae]